jgi:hypothetical protein
MNAVVCEDTEHRQRYRQREKTQKASFEVFK